MALDVELLETRRVSLTALQQDVVLLAGSSAGGGTLSWGLPCPRGKKIEFPSYI